LISEEDYENVYIVGHSSEDCQDVLEELIEAGINEFECKPTNIKNIRKILENVTRFFEKE